MPDPPPDDAGAFDRGRARQWLKEQIAGEPPLVKQIDASVQDAKRNVFRAANAKLKRSSQDRLAATQVVDMLRRNIGVHPQPLLAAGIYTAAHLLELGEGRLRSKTGVDHGAAAKWVDAAREIKRTREGDLRPPDEPSRWQDEDVALARALLVLDSAYGLQFAPATTAMAQLFDEARVLSRRTAALNWKLSTHKTDLARQIADLAQRFTARRVADHLPQVEAHAARHRGLEDRLRDAREVAELWRHKREDLLELLKEEHPHRGH